MFRFIRDLIDYFKGDLSRQRDLTLFYRDRARTIEKDLIRRHPDIEEDLLRYSNYITACASLTGARLGTKEMERLINETEF